MNLQCTKTLLDKLKIKADEIDISNSSDIENWHSNILKYGKTNCVLITNDKTLFSFFIYGLRADEFRDFNYVVSHSIFKTMFDLEFKREEVEIVLKSLENITFSKSSNRSVTSSMTNMKQLIEMKLLSGDSILEINQFINRVPYKFIKYNRSIDLFRELLFLYYIYSFK